MIDGPPNPTLQAMPRRGRGCFNLVGVEDAFEITGESGTVPPSRGEFGKSWTGLQQNCPQMARKSVLAAVRLRAGKGEIGRCASLASPLSQTPRSIEVALPAALGIAPDDGVQVPIVFASAAPMTGIAEHTNPGHRSSPLHAPPRSFLQGPSRMGEVVAGVQLAPVPSASGSPHRGLLLPPRKRIAFIGHSSPRCQRVDSAKAAKAANPRPRSGMVGKVGKVGSGNIKGFEWLGMVCPSRGYRLR